MKILMVYPAFESWYLNIYKKLMNINNENVGTHHGIGYIIKYAKEKGEAVDFIDLRLISKNEFKEIVKSYDLVGYSIISMNYKNAIKYIRINKKINKDVTIVVGGVDPNADTKKYEENPLIDHIILGEGEISFLELIKSKKEGKKLEKIIVGKKIENLNSLGFIDRDSLPFDNPPSAMFKEPHFTILASRVCLYNCKFCQPVSREMFGKKIRSRSPDHVVKELVFLKEKYGLGSYYFMDDNVLQDRQWTVEFISCLKKHGINVNFSINGRANNIVKNQDLIKELREVGLTTVFIGLESGSDKILKYLNKGTTVNLNKSALKILNENNINVSSIFMFGFSAEKKEDYHLTEKFIKENDLDFYAIFSFVPFPGNYLNLEYKEKNLLFPGAENADIVFHRPRVKGVNYYYIAFMDLKLCMRLQNNFFNKIMKIISFIFNIIIISYFYIVYSIKRVWGFYS